MNQRYSKQTNMAGFGQEGQTALANARVAIVGMGGLGCPAAMYLAMAGVGELVIIDDDTVEVSNLARQPLYCEQDCGEPKVDVAAKRLSQLNPEVVVRSNQTRFGFDSGDLLLGVDFVLDCADNEAASHAVNAFSLASHTPWTHASVYKLETRLVNFSGAGGPCFACYSPPVVTSAGCDIAGTLGVGPGTVGIAQAAEAIKMLTGLGVTSYGTLLICDLADNEQTKFRISSQSDCVACANNASLLAYSKAVMNPGENAMDLPQMNPSELKAKLDAGEKLVVLDVRGQDEWDICNLGDQGSVLIPMDEISDRIGELDPLAATVVHCRSGGRSAEVVRILQGKGFNSIWNLDGGILGWADDIDQSLTKY